MRRNYFSSLTFISVIKLSIASRINRLLLKPSTFEYLMISFAILADILTLNVSAFPSEWDKASLTLERENTVYNINIINNNTGSKKIYVNDTLINGDFVEFSDAASVEIRIEL